MEKRAHDAGRGARSALVTLRVLVVALVAVHVLLITADLRAASLEWIGFGALAALVAVAVSSVAASAASSSSSASASAHLRPSAWLVAGVEALALVAIARVTVEVDPAASIAWAFVLWVPFSIAVRATTVTSIATSGAIALFVLGSTQLSIPGSLAPIELSWTGVGVPVLLVVVAALLTTMSTLSHQRAVLDRERELDDERGRTLRLREADEVKNTFLAAVSHELRTPLTSILGFAITMLDRPQLDELQRDRMLRMMVSEAEHLEDILANLLDLDRLTRGKATLVVVDVDIDELVRTTVDHVEQRSGRNVDVTITASSKRIGLDAAKVERIVENLVGNAVKYTPIDAHVDVLVRDEGAGIVICVTDDGPGIDRSIRETIFEPFRRGADVGVPGTGIGLSLVDRFSRMHGGRAWVEERPGGGCRFLVYLMAQTVTHASLKSPAGRVSSEA